MGKVLVIDDSDRWFSAVAAECEKVGFSALRAMNHDEAMSVANEQRPSLVVVDLLVAARAGAGFIRQLRSLPHMKNTTMLLATSGTSHASAKQAVGGAAEIVGKDSDSLVRLSEHLRKMPLNA